MQLRIKTGFAWLPRSITFYDEPIEWRWLCWYSIVQWKLGDLWFDRRFLTALELEDRYWNSEVFYAELLKEEQAKIAREERYCGNSYTD